MFLASSFCLALSVILLVQKPPLPKVEIKVVEGTAGAGTSECSVIKGNLLAHSDG